MKKQILTAFLALTLCMGLAVPAFAETDSTAINGISTYFLGKYTLEKQDVKSSSDSFVAQEIIFDFDSNPPAHNGYYAITEDIAWTVSNTASDDFGLMISFRERCKEGNHYSTHNICWVLSDGTFSLAFKGVNHEDYILESGQSVTFSLKNAISAMKVTADPDSLYEIEIMDSNYPGDGDRYLFKLDSNTNSDVTDEESTSSPAFTDVPAGQFYTAAVDWAVSGGITNGTSDTTFSPGQDCTQAQILTFLYRAAGESASSGNVPVTVAPAYSAAVSWAYDKGMIDGSFDPSAPCTRSQAVSYIWQALGKPDAEKSSFTDVPAGADYAAAVDWALANGVTNGTTDTTFGPDEVCSRGHIVTFLHRAYVEEARLTVK